MSATSISRKAVGLVVLVFALGIALGGVGAHLWDAHVLAKRHHPSIVQQLKDDLQLSPSQAKQVDAILSDDHAKFRALDAQEHAEWHPKYAALDTQRHAEWDPKVDQVRQQGRNSIRALLTPEQRTKFDAFLKHLDEERKKEEGH
ncbi:MAG: Spy/CpxP family protein refolding chaperone [Candidatus Acidiferrales bacterium]